MPILLNVLKYKEFTVEMEPAKDRGLSMPNTEITTMNLTTL
jgi:hypothetical protein